MHFEWLVDFESWSFTHGVESCRKKDSKYPPHVIFICIGMYLEEKLDVIVVDFAFN